ncbi:hypothetical protein H4219_000366 [Mycoemilia scoparia]|uniref:Uncharacterized protein n=1 Tax=Mycoemilia scoparia TaxID=417184 RepID=A0A9W8A3E3_9FUNG|nr:hypothetical protein H4219_000366 [Mycoemilia scoparia]
MSKKLSRSDLKILGVSAILPPLGVLLKHGKMEYFWKSIPLTALGVVPGIAYAWYVVLKYPGINFREQLKGEDVDIWSTTDKNDHVIYLVNDTNSSMTTINIPEYPRSTLDIKCSKEFFDELPSPPASPTTATSSTFNFSGLTLPELVTSKPLSEDIVF